MCRVMHSAHSHSIRIITYYVSLLYFLDETKSVCMTVCVYVKKKKAPLRQDTKNEMKQQNESEKKIANSLYFIVFHMQDSKIYCSQWYSLFSFWLLYACSLPLSCPLLWLLWQNQSDRSPSETDRGEMKQSEHKFDGKKCGFRASFSI